MLRDNDADAPRSICSSVAATPHDDAVLHARRQQTRARSSPRERYMLTRVLAECCSGRPYPPPLPLIKRASDDAGSAGAMMRC